jgi:hypothetical protein
MMPGSGESFQWGGMDKAGRIKNQFPVASSRFPVPSSSKPSARWWAVLNSGRTAGSGRGEGGMKNMKKQIALLGIIFLISAAYAISAAKQLGFWGGVFFVFVWVSVFLWARSRK